jgi:DNA-binding MarR family transcriptional regulator
MKADPLKLENQVCFPLYACSREIIKAYRPFLRKFGLTYTQYLVMLLLWSEKQLTAKAIGQYLHLDSGTLTPLLKKMEEKNLLCRERLEADERILVVAITSSGEQMREQAASIPAQMASCLAISAEEAKLLCQLIYKVLANLKTDEPK